MFFGDHKYEIKEINTVTPASITAGMFTTNDSLIFGSFVKNVQKYSATTAAATKKVASQIRRCQKRVNVTGLMLPPTSYANLIDIMTIMLRFYK